MKMNFNIEFKMIFSSVLFILFLVGVERYEFTQNIIQQFIESKKEKNQLLIETISPIVALNISLGLDQANTEYLQQIVKQNKDLVDFTLMKMDNSILYRYQKKNIIVNREGYYVDQIIKDPVSQLDIARISIMFDDKDYQILIQRNNQATIKMFFITFIMLALLILYIKKEFKFLKLLSEEVQQYDPHKNNFALAKSFRKDEVGIIQNAIVTMVQKITLFATQLEEMNQSLSDKVLERTKELQEANDKLLMLSLTDPMTNLPNRRFMESDLQRIWELARRDQTSIAIIMCDIDYFKIINDTYGHMMGDMVLIEVASILKSVLKRNSDFVARYGGEEFIIVLYDADISEAEQLCKKIQDRLLGAENFDYTGVKLESVTLSFGVSGTIPTYTSIYQELIEMADRALYRAKENGRNQFVSFGA